MNVDSRVVAAPVNSGRHIRLSEETIDPIVEDDSLELGHQGEAVPDKDQYSHYEEEANESEEARGGCGWAMGGKPQEQSRPEI